MSGFVSADRGAREIVYSAIDEHSPRRTFVLFSGGGDNSVLLHWVAGRLDGELAAAVHIDTGTALPGVREHAEAYCASLGVPLRTGQLEQLVGKLQAQSLAANSVRNAFMPLQAIYRWARRRELARVDPTNGVELPLDRERRDRFVPRDEIERRLAALPVNDRRLWASAFYVGLRYGELMALRWSDVNMASGVIHVQLSHGPQAHVTGTPKSIAGVRRVPIPGPLRDHLLQHRMRRDPQQSLVFSRWSLGGRKRGPDGPFNASAIYQRARRHWEPLGIGSVSLHDWRHTYASLMIAAGENAKALQTYLGHSSITTTYDRYGHLMPGAERESADRLSAYLDVQDVCPCHRQRRHDDRRG
jgi:integrase